jgi:cytochrome c biogenesis protein CcmG/thiol:disulfide interchange protein DsbE
MRGLVTASALLSLVGLAACGGGAAPAASSGAAAPQASAKTAPDFELKDVDGKPFHFADAKGTVRLVDFWATWCAPCREEIPMFKELQATYGEKGFKLVGIAMDDEGVDKIKPFVDELKIPYLTLIGNEQVATSFGGIVGFPSKFLIDREGRIVDSWVGVVPRSVLEKRIQSLL